MLQFIKNFCSAQSVKEAPFGDWTPGLARNYMQLHMHVRTHTIIFETYFFFKNWPFRNAIITYLAVAKSKVAHEKTYLYFFSLMKN